MTQSEPLESLILTMRGQKVLLDADLAAIYGVTTKALNQAVKRNVERFPEDFMLQLTPEEWQLLNRSQIVTGSQKHRDPRSLPKVFTEHGAIMAATVLNSAEAVKMSVFVVRAFVKMREHLAANAAILKRLAEIDKTLIEHDRVLLTLWQQIQPLLIPPPDPPPKEIGFHVKDRSAAYRTRRRSKTGAS